MAEIRASIPLLRFCAGPLYLGIAAEDVVSITPEVTMDDVHIACLLGVAPGDAERRTIQLWSGLSPRVKTDDDSHTTCSFQADMPLNVVHCEVDQILPLPSGVPAKVWDPVMGFARIADQVILLLDIPSVVQALSQRHQGGQS